jgi:hypothetical protein
MAAQRGVYTVSFDQQTIANASGDYDLFELVPADDRPIELVALFLGNKSEVGDAQDEMLAISIITDYTTSSNGTSTTPRPLDSRDGAAGFTAETVGATVATAGTPITVHVDTFNVRSGYQLILPEFMRPKVDQGDTALYVRITTAVADDLTLSGTAYVREL